MSPNLTHPSELNVFVANSRSKFPSEEIIDEKINLLGGGIATKIQFSDENETKRFLIALTSDNVTIKFWIGFSDVRAAELFRHDYTSLTT
jgi:hypothetical protein